MLAEHFLNALGVSVRAVEPGDKCMLAAAMFAGSLVVLLIPVMSTL